MATFTLRTPMPAPADEVFAWHTRPGAFQRLQPPWENVTVLATEGRFGNGQRVVIRTPVLGPVKTTWVAELYGVEPGLRFRDRQLSGPFAAWDHTHTMTPEGPDRSFLEEHIEYRLPLGAAGRLLTSGMVRDR